MITEQLRASCCWANDIALRNALDLAVLDRDAGFTAQEAIYEFVDTCVDVCSASGEDALFCQVNCSNCGAALVAEVWGR